MAFAVYLSHKPSVGMDDADLGMNDIVKLRLLLSEHCYTPCKNELLNVLIESPL